MYMDVLKLRSWYATFQGRVVRRVLRPYVKDFFAMTPRQQVLVLGYGVPYITEAERQTSTIICAMPAQMGVVHWPTDEANQTVMVWDDNLPFVDNQFDAVVVTHALEFAHQPEDLLGECWRVLRPEGQVLLLAPNRTGAWCRNEDTPFGRGQPYSASQLERLCRHANLDVLETDYSLFVPPTEHRWLLKMAHTLENMGHGIWALIGGVLMIRARKDVHGGVAVRVKPKLRRRKESMASAAGVMCEEK